MKKATALTVVYTILFCNFGYAQGSITTEKPSQNGAIAKLAAKEGIKLEHPQIISIYNRNDAGRYTRVKLQVCESGTDNSGITDTSGKCVNYLIGHRTFSFEELSDAVDRMNKDQKSRTGLFFQTWSNMITDGTTGGCKAGTQWVDSSDQNVPLVPFVIITGPVGCIVGFAGGTLFGFVGGAVDAATKNKPDPQVRSVANGLNLQNSGDNYFSGNVDDAVRILEKYLPN